SSGHVFGEGVDSGRAASETPAASISLSKRDFPRPVSVGAWDWAPKLQLLKLVSSSRSDQHCDLIRAWIDEIEPGPAIRRRADRRRNGAVGKDPAIRQDHRIERTPEAPIPYQLVSGDLVARGIGVGLVHPQPDRLARLHRREPK